jgi:formyltetrahydrofolate deformylase
MYGIGRKPRMALFVSKYDHCLYDILGRYSAVASRNSFDHQQPWRFKTWNVFSIPFHYVPFTKISKPKSKRNIEFTEKYNIDFYCFGTLHANYHTEFDCTIQESNYQYSSSFTSAFPGAKPYHSAFKRRKSLAPPVIM